MSHKAHRDILRKIVWLCTVCSIHAFLETFSDIYMYVHMACISTWKVVGDVLLRAWWSNHKLQNCTSSFFLGRSLYHTKDQFWNFRNATLDACLWFNLTVMSRLSNDSSSLWKIPKKFRCPANAAKTRYRLRMAVVLSNACKDVSPSTASFKTVVIPIQTNRCNFW